MIVDFFDRRGEPCPARLIKGELHIGFHKVNRIHHGLCGIVQLFFEDPTRPLTISPEQYRKLAPLLPVAQENDDGQAA